jgi:hypothetical protein
MTRSHRFMTLFLLCLPLLSAQDAEPSPFLSHPAAYRPGEWHGSAGLTLTILPRSIVEEEIRQIPMLNASVRYGLPNDLSLQGSFSTVYLTNVISAGILWSVAYGPVWFGFSDHLSYWFGVADMEGFDTGAMGLVNTPGIGAGLDIDGYKVSSRTELLLLISQHTYFGSASVGRIKPEVAGIISSLTLEQDLWNGTSFAFTLRANYARPNYQLWLAFSVQDRWLVYPELQASFLF